MHNIQVIIIPLIFRLVSLSCKNDGYVVSIGENVYTMRENRDNRAI